MNTLIPTAIDKIVPQLFFYKDGFSIKLPNKETKPNHISL